MDVYRPRGILLIELVIVAVHEGVLPDGIGVWYSRILGHLECIELREFGVAVLLMYFMIGE